MVDILALPSDTHPILKETDNSRNSGRMKKEITILVVSDSLRKWCDDYQRGLKRQ